MSTGISTGPNLVQSEVENPDASMRYGSVNTQVADILEPPTATDSLVLLLHGGVWDDSNRMRT